MKPGPQYNMRETIRRAFESMRDTKIEDLAEHSGGRISGSGDAVDLTILGRPVTVAPATGTILDADGNAVSEYFAAPIVRYVASCHGLVGESGEMIGFADVADSRGYLGPFRGRVIAPLLGAFGNDIVSFERASADLSGRRVPELELPGAVAVRLPVYPRAALVFVLNAGDEEFPPEGQALFPRAVFRAFAVDDIVAMGDLASRGMRGKLPLPRHGS